MISGNLIDNTNKTIHVKIIIKSFIISIFTKCLKPLLYIKFSLKEPKSFIKTKWFNNKYALIEKANAESNTLKKPFDILQYNNSQRKNPANIIIE